VSLSEGLSAWIGEVAGGRPGPLIPLSGATSADVFGVEVAGLQLVVKHFVFPAFVDEEPDRAIHEAEILDHVAAHSTLPVPRIVAVDPDGSRSGAPAVLMTRLEGSGGLTAVTPAALEQLADRAAEIHDIPIRGVRWRHERYNQPESAFVPSWATDAGLWREAFERAAVDQPYDPVFIHRDYHPGNVLWREGTATGVVDWLYACVGPAGEDFGRVVVNLALQFGTIAAGEFVALIGSHHAPFWTLACWMDWLPFDKGAGAVEAWGADGERSAYEALLHLIMQSRS